MLGGDTPSVIAAGLPNITGSTTFTKRYGLAGDDSIQNGVFGSGSDHYSALAGGGGGYTLALTFDASKSNEIYGKSDKVLPDSFALIAQIKY